MIKKVQGFASRSVGLVDTRPEISEEEAVQTLRDQWNHTKTVEEVEVRLDDPELQVLHTVSKDVNTVRENGYNLLQYLQTVPSRNWKIDHFEEVVETTVQYSMLLRESF
mgnify:FL=1